MSSIKIRIKRQQARISIRVLVIHPMETGRRRDEQTGMLIPAHYIENLRVEYRGRVIADCRFSTGVSRDPYLELWLREGESGEVIRVSWVDNLGQSDSAEASLP